MYEVHGDQRVNPAFRAYPFTGSILYYHVYKLIDSYVKQNSILIDLGAYPGTFLRLCKSVLFPSIKMDLYGCSLICEENEVDNYVQRHNANPVTKSILTDKTFLEFIKTENIEMFCGNLDYCNSHKMQVSTERHIEEVYGQCDFVTCMEVIEHLHTPYHLFDVFNKLLRRGGICVVETNNVRWLGRLLLMLKTGTNLDLSMVEKYKLDDLTIKHPHLRFYSLSEVETLFRKAGFAVRVKYDFNWYYPFSLYGVNIHMLKAMAKKLVSVIPGFRSHIIIMAEKL